LLGWVAKFKCGFLKQFIQKLKKVFWKSAELGTCKPASRMLSSVRVIKTDCSGVKTERTACKGFF
jgi:hypothetical protein